MKPNSNKQWNGIKRENHFTKLQKTYQTRLSLLMSIEDLD